MAVISATRLKGGGPHQVVYKWASVGQNDTCEAVKVVEHDDATISAFGTFGASAAIALHGSPEIETATPTQYFPMSSSGTAISLTAPNTAKVVDENAPWLKPVITNGDGSTAIDVYVSKQ